MLAAPPWSGGAGAPRHPPLLADDRTSVCVVGGGVAGLITALLLARRGVPVIVLEQGWIGAGESGRSTAHLTTALDHGYRALERRLGARASRLAAESHSAALEMAAGLCASQGISCQLETLDGFVIGRPDREGELDAELECVRRAGLIEVERLGRVPGDAFGAAGCLRYPRQAQLNPARLLAGLARALERLGGRIHGGTRVVAIEGAASVRVQTEAGPRVDAEAAVLAAHDVPGDRSAGRRKPYRTYVLAASLPTRSVPRALYWEWGRPYRYVRVFGARSRSSEPEERELLLVGGEDHPTGQVADPEERYRRLEAWMRERFPMARSVTHRWSGQILESSDGLAAIGRDPRRAGVLFATGFSGNGMTHGVVAGMLLSDLILGRENPWAALYDPSRPQSRAWRLARRGLRFARGLSAWLAPAEARAARALEPGCGTVVRRGLQRVALYRDPAGRLHRLSAVCPHEGCIVRWNAAERSWDCPCHGSRYDGLGKVVNGPSVTGLNPLEREQDPS